MRNASLWQRLLGVEGAIVERVEFDDAEADDSDLRVIAQVRVRKGERYRCWAICLIRSATVGRLAAGLAYPGRSISS